MQTTRRTIRWAPGFFGLVSLLFACVGYTVAPAPMPKDPTPKGAGKVCVARVGTDGALSTFPIKDNNILVGATVGGSCFCYFAAEGTHDMEARSDGFDTLSFEVKAGKDVVILQSTRAAVGIVRSRLEELSAEDGKGAMAGCQYSVLSTVPDGTYRAKPGMVVVAK